MSNRITERDLQATVARINHITNSPTEPYTRDEDGQFKANIGNYHLSHAYGGVCLHRMVSDGGGIQTPIIGGHTTKRELFNLMQAYISGILDTKELTK